MHVPATRTCPGSVGPSFVISARQACLDSTLRRLEGAPTYLHAHLIVTDAPLLRLAEATAARRVVPLA
jgi:hypothetical protein